jgi:hypothetical protein
VAIGNLIAFTNTNEATEARQRIIREAHGSMEFYWSRDKQWAFCRSAPGADLQATGRLRDIIRRRSRAKAGERFALRLLTGPPDFYGGWWPPHVAVELLFIGFHHDSVMIAPLARLLPCMVSSVARPIAPMGVADARVERGPFSLAPAGHPRHLAVPPGV